MKWIQIIVLTLTLSGCSDNSNTKAPKSQTEGSGGLRVTLNTMASGYDLKIKINGVDVGSLKPSNPEFSTVALQLFHTEHAMKENAEEENANLFCLREDENEMEASFELVEPDKVSLLGLRISVISPAVGLSKPILNFQQGENKSGHFKVLFNCYEEMSEDFKTVVPKVE